MQGIYLLFKKSVTHYYSTLKKNEIMPFAGKWMELESFMSSKVSQVQKYKCHMFSVICRI
jgi:hypothetical protein